MWKRQIVVRGVLSLAISAIVAIFICRLGASTATVTTLCGDLFPATTGLLGILVAALTIFSSLPLSEPMKKSEAYRRTLKSYKSTITYAAAAGTALEVLRLIAINNRLVVLFLLVALTLFVYLLALTLGLVRATTEAMEL